MRPILQSVQTLHSPESLVQLLTGEPGVVLLRSGGFHSAQSRYSFVAARPFLVFRSFGSRCEFTGPGGARFGNPWHVLEELMLRYELLDEIDLPFPLGGCFGYWGYELKNFVEPQLPRAAINDLELPDCHAGFYDSLVVFDHHLDKTWVVSTGLQPDGSRDAGRAAEQLAFWLARLSEPCDTSYRTSTTNTPDLHSTITKQAFVEKVRRAQNYIRAGDIYQVNLSHRLTAKSDATGWEFFQSLAEVSPAPFAAFLDCGEFQVCSSSPEMFLRFSGASVQTRPIKGTRPRSQDPTRDAQLTYELQTSAKEMAELVMITDLLRNDLGKVCEFGSVSVPELVRLERYPQVQHLVSTVTGRLRDDQTHFSAFASCFPAAASRVRRKSARWKSSMNWNPPRADLILARLVYLGFNRESQLSIAIRTAICRTGEIHFQVGAGIVIDSVPEFEFDETMAKAGGFLAALSTTSRRHANA